MIGEQAIDARGGQGADQGCGVAKPTVIAGRRRVAAAQFQRQIGVFRIDAPDMDQKARRMGVGDEARRFPAFYRLIWNAHVAEFSDLAAAERHACMDAVAEIEQVLGIPADEILRISAKTGAGVPELLDAVVEKIPPPTASAGTSKQTW